MVQTHANHVASPKGEGDKEAPGTFLAKVPWSNPRIKEALVKFKRTNIKQYSASRKQRSQVSKLGRMQLGQRAFISWLNEEFFRVWSRDEPVLCSRARVSRDRLGTRWPWRGLPNALERT
jgi:hypothetical protein